MLSRKASGWFLAVCGFFLCSPPVVAQSPSAHIEDLGLEGFFQPTRLPTPVHVVVSNPSASSQSFTVSLSVESEVEKPPTGDESRVEITLAPGEVKRISVPVFLAGIGEPRLRLHMMDPSGRVVAADSHFLRASQNEILIPVLCRDPAVCQTLRAAMAALNALPVAKGEKRRLLEPIILQDPPEEWWDYAPSTAVILAAPAASYSQRRLTALESFARQGGELIIAERETGTPEFLSAYRTGPRRSPPILIGSGWLLRISSVEDARLAKELGKNQVSSMDSVLPHLTLRSLMNSFSNEVSDETYLLRRTATTLTFPSLAWLLGFLATYIAVVGFGSFMLLRWLGHREWGWITVPVLSLAFAAALYASSTHKRPKQTVLDEAVVAWMDDRSPTAAFDAAFRVTSPRTQTFTEVLPAGAVFTGFPAGDTSGFADITTVNQTLSVDLRRSRIWQMDFGSQVRLRSTLPQWAFRDASYQGFESFPGTVRRSSSGTLRNDTGLDFRDALFVDAATVYFLGPISAGGEANLTSARHEPLQENIGRSSMFGYPSEPANPDDVEAAVSATNPGPDNGARLEESQLRASQPFSLIELIRGWPQLSGHIFERRSGMFFGLADGSPAEAHLEGVDSKYAARTVVIVSFALQP